MSEESSEKVEKEAVEPVWIDYNEMKTYLQRVGGSLIAIAKNIDETLSQIEENITKEKEDNESKDV